MNADFPEWLAAEMQERGLTQTELAKRGGFSQPSLSRALAGGRDIGIDLAVGIAKALRVSPVTVLVRAGLLPPDTTHDETTDRFSRMLRELPDERRRVVIEFLLFEHGRASREK